MTPLHLDDEALSAAVDGEATAGEQDHLEGCPLCRERAAGLRAVARAVGTPVSPRPAGEIDAAIRVAVGAVGAVGAVDGVGAVGAAGLAGAAGTAGAVDALAGRAAQPATVGAPAGWHQATSRPARGVLALAAVAVLVLGTGLVVALAGRGPSSGRNASVAARAAQGTAFGPQPNAAAPPGPSTIGSNPATGQAASGAASAKSLPVQGFDLGNQSNSTELARIVDRQLAAAAARPTVKAEPGTLAPVPQCVDQGAAALGLAGQHPILGFAATVRWLGQDAEVLVYDPGAGRAGVVMRRQDCRLLTTLPL